MSFKDELEKIQIDLVKKVLDHSTNRMPGEVQMYKMYVDTALTSIINLVDKEKKEAIEKTFITLSQMYDEYSDECFHLGIGDNPSTFFKHEKVVKYISEQL